MGVPKMMVSTGTSHLEMDDDQGGTPFPMTDPCMYAIDGNIDKLTINIYPKC